MHPLANGLVYYLAFLFSTTAHEAAHAWAAKLGGDLTAYHGGQVSLDPRPHIRREPFGMVMLPILSTLMSGWPFGFASAPYDVEWAFRYPRRAGWMAAAGPAANLAIVLLAAIAIRVGLAAGVFVPPDAANFGSITSSAGSELWRGAAFMVSVFFSLNLMLACLNLIPLPPLDGSTVVLLGLNANLAEKYQHMLMSSQAFGMMGLLVAWQCFDTIYSPILKTALNLLYPGYGYN